MSFENGDRSKKQPSDNEGQSAQLAAGREKYDDKCSSSRFDNAIRVLPSVSGNNNGGAIPLSINVPMEAKVSVAHATTDNLGHAEKITGISTHARGAVFEGGAPPGDDTDKMKLQGQVVATSKSRSYRDYSQVANADPFRPLLAPNKHLTFPLKMHIMLSHTEFEGIVCYFSLNLNSYIFQLKPHPPVTYIHIYSSLSRLNNRRYCFVASSWQSLAHP